MTATDVLIAFAGGVVMGAAIVLIATRRHTVDRQILDHVQRIGAVFANTAQRGRAGEIVLENLLEASGMGRHRDFEVQASLLVAGARMWCSPCPGGVACSSTPIPAGRFPARRGRGSGCSLTQ